ncbi:hypothetical protein DFQ27_003897 [Actinomortierella ambigua]|uniref:Auxin efflux carrier n=1 Tax=Actinomortierella ambigua TaxID=1343610 RepID=A0A9P6Q6X0_9FUNG|nr:hypothetical protein DFQ27_003897 [Actinomortierella ambigua]
MTPCLLFVKIASTISWDQFVAFWPIPVFYAIFSILSIIVARVGSLLLGFTPEERNFVVASVLFSNTNSLPMALLQSLAFSAAGKRLLRDEQDTAEKVAARGISYILFYAIFGNLVRWSYGFTLLVPKDKPQIMPPEGILIQVDDHPIVQTVSSAPPPPNSVIRRKFASVVSGIRQILTPPLLTALASLVIGLVPQLHELFMSENSKIYSFLVRPLESCGAAAIPMILLCLGAQVVGFAQGDSSKVDNSKGQQQVQAQQQQRPYQDQDSDSDDEDQARTNLLKRLSTATLHSDISSSATLQFTSQPVSPFSAASLSPAVPKHSNGKFYGSTAHYSRPHDRSRRGSSSSTASNSTSVSEDELPLLPPPALPLNDSAMIKYSQESHHRIIGPIPFVLLARNLIAPLLCLPFILFHPDTMSPVLTQDPTFSLSLVLIAAAPTAINTVQMCQIKGFFEKEMAGVLFWSYCVIGIPCILGWSVVGLWAAGRE